LTKSWRDDWLELGIIVGPFGRFGPLGPSLPRGLGVDSGSGVFGCGPPRL